MRCPDCQKFVSYDEPQASLESSDVDDEGNYTAEVRVMLGCAECSTELKEAYFELEGQADHECKKAPEDSSDLKGFEVASENDPEAWQDVQKTDRKGKPITNPRYQATLYGVTLDVQLTCLDCQEVVDLSLSDSINAGSMDELV